MCRQTCQPIARSPDRLQIRSRPCRHWSFVSMDTKPSAKKDRTARVIGLKFRVASTRARCPSGTWSKGPGCMTRRSWGGVHPTRFVEHRHGVSLRIGGQVRLPQDHRQARPAAAAREPRQPLVSRAMVLARLKPSGRARSRGGPRIGSGRDSRSHSLQEERGNEPLLHFQPFSSSLRTTRSGRTLTLRRSLFPCPRRKTQNQNTYPLRPCTAPIAQTTFAPWGTIRTSVS